MPTGRRAPTLDRATSRRVWVVVLAALCVVVAAQAGPWQPTPRVGGEVWTIDPVTPPPLPAQEDAQDPVAEPVPPADPVPDLTWVRRVVTIAVVAVLLFLLVRWALRRQLPGRPPPPDDARAGPVIASPRDAAEPDLEVLHEGARAAAEHLRADLTPADAVIAAWVALEDAAARSGVVRERSATATEFTLQVLDRTPADPAAARTLLGLYLRARFDDQPLADHDVQSAARAARALVDTVDHRTPGDRGHGPPARGAGP